MQRKLGWRIRYAVGYKSLKKHDMEYRYFSSLCLSDKKSWIFNRVSKITQHAQQHNPFYHEFYHYHDFNSNLLRTFDDLSNIPIVSKKDLRSSASKWMLDLPKYTSSNTGGTSGNPLKFYTSKTQRNREFFYVNKILDKLGGSRKENRAVFRGVNLGDVAWKYSSDYDAFFINMYKPLSEIAPELLHFFSTTKIQFLHGYPSTIYQFASYCLKKENLPLRKAVNSNLKGILLSSEYPALCYRDVIETAFPVFSISFYGHTEGTVLAVEDSEPFIYKAYHSYGFVEGIEFNDGNTHLIGTSYDNIASPFIRYDTEDSILPIGLNNNLLNSFAISNGRIGEYILDIDLNQISLTALIFGRHHKIFEIADFVQISQDKPGFATIHITTSQSTILHDINTWFDLTNVNILFTLKRMISPIRTKIGKVPLLIPK